MRRIFQKRARVVVHMELEDAQKIESKARSAGKTFAEWTRETLLGALNHNADVPGATKVSIARRRVSTRGAHARAVAEVVRLEDAANPESDRPVRGPGDCPHGVPKGWRCTLCGGVVK